MHGTCSFHKNGETPLDPCNSRQPCICEYIAEYDTETDEIKSSVGSLEKYFDDAFDHYTVEGHLKPELTLLKMQELRIDR